MGSESILYALINEIRQLLVSCGGGRRLADRLRKQHGRTIRLPVWDTLEDFSATLDCTYDRTKTFYESTLHVRGELSSE